MTVTVHEYLDPEGPPPGCCWCGSYADAELRGDPEHWLVQAVCNSCLRAIVAWTREAGVAEVIPVGAQEIATLLGVQATTVHTWRQRDLLPPPSWVVSGQPTWNRADVLAWAGQTSRLLQIRVPMKATCFAGPQAHIRTTLPANTGFAILGYGRVTDDPTDAEFVDLLADSNSWRVRRSVFDAALAGRLVVEATP